MGRELEVGEALHLGGYEHTGKEPAPMNVKTSDSPSAVPRGWGWHGPREQEAEWPKQL